MTDHKPAPNEPVILTLDPEWFALQDDPEVILVELQKIISDATTAAQHPATLVHEARGLEVGIWPAHPDMAADGGPHAIVVQIDTGESTGRLRVNINDATVWDGDPQTDRRPGGWFHTEPSAEDHKGSIALTVISIEDLQTLVDAAGKWSTELNDYIIPSAEESSAEDAASYTAQMEQIDNALSRVRALLVSAQNV